MEIRHVLAGLPILVGILLLAVGDARAQDSATDYDSDDGGLIEVADLAQLNAIRWDLDGDGLPDNSSASSGNGAAFPGAAEIMGCPKREMLRLRAHRRSRLRHQRYRLPGLGRFGIARWDGWNRFSGLNNNIRNVALVNVDVHGGSDTGGLIGDNGLIIVASYVTGSVTGDLEVGGLVGSNFSGTVIASFSTASVSGGINVGGLAGSRGTATDSYWDTQTLRPGRECCAGGEGKTTSELQSPTGYTGIYANWNLDLDDDRISDNLWDFGTSSQYPVLKGLALSDPGADTAPPSQPQTGEQTYYFPHLAVGASWQTTITLINYSPDEVTCQTDFISDHGSPLLVSFPSLGSVISRTDLLPPGGSIHEQTDVELGAPLAPGWAKAACTGPVKASLLFRQYDSEGMPVAEAGVNATTVPANRFITFAEQAEGRTGTGVAYANPSDTAADVTFTARDTAGQTLASVVRTVLPGGHDAQVISVLFGFTSFSRSLEVTSTEPIVSLSLNFEAAPVFSSLPPGEVDEPAP